MKLTEQEIELFRQLGDSPTGQTLREYLERLIDQLCDIRTMEGVSETERLGRLEATKIIQSQFIAKIHRSTKAKGNTQYE